MFFIFSIFRKQKIIHKEDLEINNEITARQKMSALAIKNNYFNYLGNKFKTYKNITETNNIQESEES